MPSFRRLFRFPWRTARQIEREVDEELQFHLDLRAEELAESGLTPEAAREEAARQFGDLASTREYCSALDRETEKATRRSTLLDELRQDLRYGARLLRRSPGFTISVALTLAIAIGANTTVFSLIKALAFPSVPVAEPHRLALLWGANPARGVFISPLSAADLADLKQATRSFTEVAAYVLERPHLTGGTRPDRIVAIRGTTNLLPLLGVRPAVGRGFRPGDARGQDDVVLLSHRAWELRFAEDPGVVGRTVQLEGRPHTVIGVLPEGFWFASRDVQAWLPRGNPRPDASREARTLQVIGRLSPSATAAEAQAEAEVLAQRAAAEHPATNEGWGIRVTGLLPLGPGERVFFGLVMGLVALLLAGVEGAGAATQRPVQLGRSLPGATITVEDRHGSLGSEPDWAQESSVTTGYFEALEIPLVAGRLYERRDAASDQESVVINRAMAERYWPGRDPVGRRLKRGPAEADGPWLTVVGVVGNVRNDDPPSPRPPRLYLLEPRHPGRALMYFAATRDDPREHFEAVRSAVARADPEQPVTDLRSLDQVMSDDYAGASLGSGALEAFGIVAVALAGIGVYSMLAYSVSRRRREMAIRLALGASERGLLGLVLRQGLRAVLAGIVVGVVAALFVSRGLTTILFGVGPSDPLTYGAVVLLIVAMAMAASFLPALRAARGDPAVALRHE